MTSETRIAYGSAVLRHGRFRFFSRYQASRSVSSESFEEVSLSGPAEGEAGVALGAGVDGMHGVYHAPQIAPPLLAFLLSAGALLAASPERPRERDVSCR
jgi:hypothetical protein